MSESATFNLLAAKLEEAKREHERLLNAALFANLEARPVAPLSRRQRWRMKRDRVTRYLSTLWDALRGRDPFDWDREY